MAKKKKITKKLLHKYRLIILNEETFEERLTFKLSRLNVFVIGGLMVVFLIFMTTILIAFTPLREYIPGYSSTRLRQQAMHLVYKTDSLEAVIHNNQKYFSSIQMVLRGDSIAEDLDLDTLKDSKLLAGEIDLSPSKADSLLRREVEQKDKYNVFESAEDISDFKLFPPVQGQVTEPYNPQKQHYGVDISISENKPVKATANGTVIFAEWTSETGFVIILEHSYGLLSVYKHNSSLTRTQGDLVRAGEVIAMSGNTGEFTTGPHLHFELWRGGHPINPEDFMDFGNF